ncbi:uncharacterized protein LOC110443587 [Mizuhopecten yessoensis]|uniref:Methyltransferase FkbM domain-containing protein n=1 Tax=Mizuhopecten yessoensis TaxID=6573 RepID=A0A210PEI7_MIZYE|nr:uncharacterized protein LOC110443587 [Mizuhopecten yessoensis]OWF34899.1 hypothetical protein KP79_PYT08695 [Mizuhopecten yessoensis]
MVELHPGRLRCRTVVYVVVILTLIATVFISRLSVSRRTPRKKIKEKSRKRQQERDYIDVTRIEHKVQTQFLEPTDEALNETLYAPTSRRRRKNHCKVFRGSTEGPKHCVPLKTKYGETPICIFDPVEDRMISSYIRDYGTWEPDLVNMTIDILQANPAMQFIDLGCNLGVFTLSVAKLGRRVVSVDILSRALDNLQHSLKLGNLTENVTLILNAMSNTREKVKINLVPDNIGGSHVGQHGDMGQHEELIYSIIMDDLLEIIDSGEVFVKMDIEGHEQKALENSKEFFHKANVKFLLMEWMLHKGKPSGDKIIKYLLSNGLLPYLDYNLREVLPLGRASFWPDNVLWAKR